MDHYAPKPDHVTLAEHRQLRQVGGRTPHARQGYVLSRWDRGSTNTPLSRKDRNYLRKSRFPAIRDDARERCIRLVNVFGAVVRLTPQIAILLMVVWTAACNSVLTPAHASASIQHHNIPAVAPDGTVWYLCETQPRTYSLNGQQRMERDHYLQKTTCPTEPIS